MCLRGAAGSLSLTAHSAAVRASLHFILHALTMADDAEDSGLDVVEDEALLSEEGEDEDEDEPSSSCSLLSPDATGR